MHIFIGLMGPKRNAFVLCIKDQNFSKKGGHFLQILYAIIFQEESKPF